MATWKKVIVSGSIAELNQVTASGGFSGDGSGLTGISADSLANNLTVDDSTVALDSGTTFNGSAAKTISVKNAGITMAKLANIATDTFIGRTASGTGVPTALTKTEALAILNVEDGATADQDLSGLQASLTFGIANGNAVDIDDADAANGDYAKFTANGLQGRSTAEVLSDIGASTVAQLNTSSSALQTNIDAKQDTLTFGISNTNVLRADSNVANDDFLRVAGTSIEGRSASEVLSDIGAQASLTFGIANDNAVEIDDADAANGDYAKFTANGLEGRSASEVRSDLGIEAGATADQTGVEIIALLGGDLGGDFTIGNQSDDTATFSGDVTVTGDLIINGDTTTLSTTNLSIEDKFITIASGSTSATDGGIIVSKQANGAGFGFGYDTATTRWVFDNDLAVAATGIVADAFVSVTTGSTSAPSAAPTYGGSGNGFGTMHVKTNTGDIYIYA